MAYHGYRKPEWITVVETKAFRERAKTRMTEEEVGSAIVMIASEPRCGSLIRGTGGIRKVRCGVAGRGRRGGVRIVYYFCNNEMPVFLLTVFAKNEKDDLTVLERRQLAGLVKQLRDCYRSRQED